MARAGGQPPFRSWGTPDRAPAGAKLASSHDFDWIGERTDDPNTGIAPAEDGEGGYVEAWSSDDKDLNAFWSSVEGISHLGGVNFGGGNAQIDLESGAFYWAQ
ncbi:hypothetical protein ACIGD1_26160 [Streptomyces sp. NPDC085612]|uniref:hypothetical protein n=1 Tax=Streptomyces sp. NPDC085612 TaxID=3365732 RepID=UPI0037D6D280